MRFLPFLCVQRGQGLGQGLAKHTEHARNAKDARNEGSSDQRSISYRLLVRDVVETVSPYIVKDSEALRYASATLQDNEELARRVMNNNS